VLPFDPGFEGAGGGFAATAADLARWAVALYEGDVLAGVRDEALAGLPAPLGPDARYGLGVMIDATELGAAVGHSGFFPGYLCAMRYYPDVGVAVAVLVNSSATPRLSLELVSWTTKLARIASGK
jgi:CubicO group peptidase (beta-lactamase class C family)